VPVNSTSVNGPVCRRAVVGMETTLDHMCADYEGAGAFFLCIAWTGMWHYKYVGLVVTPVEGRALEGVMERIGVINNLGSEWYEGGVETLVTLL